MYLFGEAMVISIIYREGRIDGQSLLRACIDQVFCLLAISSVQHRRVVHSSHICSYTVQKEGILRFTFVVVVSSTPISQKETNHLYFDRRCLLSTLSDLAQIPEAMKVMVNFPFPHNGPQNIRDGWHDCPLCSKAYFAL